MRKSRMALSLMVAGSIGASSLGDALVHGNQVSGLVSDAFAESNLSAPTRGVSGSTIVQYAMKFLGYPYTATGNSPSTGFSCIGFVSYVYQSQGINLPDDLPGAMAFASSVSFSSLLPGDVLYFQNTVWNGLSHTAIYIGGGKFIHAEWYNRGVVISSFTNDPIDGNYWTAHYLGANRPWTGAAGTTVTTPATLTPVPSSGMTGPASPVPAAHKTAVPSAAARTVQISAGPTASIVVPSLNVRSAPSMQSPVLAVVTRGAQVVVEGRQRGWYRIVLTNGTSGWVIGAGIGQGTVTPPGILAGGGDLGADRSLDPGIRRPAVQIQGVAGPTTQSLGTVTVRVDHLRVHTAASISAPVVGSLNRGQRVEAVGHVRGWVRVVLPNGGTGWVSREFVQSQMASQQPATSNDVNRKASYGQVTGPALRVRTEAMPPRTQRTASIPGRPRARALSALNVRGTPSLRAIIRAVVLPGNYYQIIGQARGWVHARLSNGDVGWISRSALSNSSSITAHSPVRPRNARSTRESVAKAPVVTATVRVHASPGLNSTALGLISAGTRVRVLRSSAGWTRIRLPDRLTGYVLGLYVKS